MSDAGTRVMAWIARENEKIRAHGRDEVVADVDHLMDEIAGWLSRAEIPHERTCIQVRENDLLIYQAPAI